MKIAILGAGMIGGTMARLLTGLGHEVAIANRRGEEAVRPLLAELGGRAHWAATDDAAQWGDMVLLAAPWRTPQALPRPETVAGKIVIDAMNPYAEGGGILDLGDSSSSEHTLSRLPESRLVKAFNTIYYKHLAAQGRPDLPVAERRAIPIAGDDPEAKQQVAQLILDLGFAPVDSGGLREGGRRQQPGTAVYNTDLTGRRAAQILEGKA